MNDSINQIGTVVTPDQLNNQATTNANPVNNGFNPNRTPFLNQFNAGTFNSPFVVNPFTGQILNPEANPFNTGIILDPNFVTPGSGFNGDRSFPNGVSVNPTFPLTTDSGSTQETLTNTNQNLTQNSTTSNFNQHGTTVTGATGGVAGAGSTGIAAGVTQNSGNLSLLGGGVRFTTLTLGSTAVVRSTQPAGSATMTSNSLNGTTVRGIVQRKDGTFTNVRRAGSGRR